MPVTDKSSATERVDAGMRPAGSRYGAVTGVIIAVALFASTVSVAGERIVTKGPIYGGPGGGYFEEVCPHGSYLFGVSARAGSWVDQVRLICAPYAPGPRLDNMVISSTAHGGGGGNQQDAHCQPGNFIAYLRLHYTHGSGLKRQYVDTIQVGWPGHREYPAEVCVTSGDECWPGRSTVENPNDILQCGAGSVAIGLHGRSGKFVDALGLICGPFPPSAADAPPPPNPRMMQGFDLPGSDVGSLVTRNPFTCQQACSASEGCRAWTWVGKGSKCFLKNAVPAAVSNACCTSGVVERGELTETPAPPPASDRPIKDMGAPKTKEGCDAKGYLWVPQKER